MAVISYRQALHDTLRAELQRDEDVLLLGEEIGVFEGSYKITAGLLAEFGPRRVRDTPICEEGFTGVAIGAAMTGLRPVVEIMTINFSRLAIDQSVNHAAKLRSMFGGQVSVPLVIRTPQGRRPAAVGDPLTEPGGLVRPRRSPAQGWRQPRWRPWPQSRTLTRRDEVTMLPVSWDTVRLFLHVLAATIWVGGQITLAALVPALRRLGAEIPRAAARRFNQVAWPAFGVLVIAGVWNTTSSQRYLPHVRPPDASYPHETPCTAGQDSNPVEGAS